MPQIEMLNHALQYAELGWKVFPVRKNKTPFTENGLLDASLDPDQINLWWSAHKYAGIGVATGKASNIVVLDIDNKDGKNGSESLNRFLADRQIELTTPVMSITGSGGMHIFYKYPDDLPENQTITNHVNFLGLNGIDIRGEGGYIILPPSLHPSNNRYAWSDHQSPFDNTLSKCPEFIKENQRSPGINLSEKIGNGERNDKLTRIGGLLRSMGLDQDEILTMLLKHNDQYCDPPLSSEEIEIIAESVSRYAPYNTRQTSEALDLRALLQYHHTDTGAAELLEFCNKDKIKFNHLTGTWLIWKNDTWQVDKSGEMIQLSISAARALYNAAQFEEDESIQAAIYKRARQLENSRNVISSLSIARTLPNISTNGFEWNSIPNLLGVANGVIDLNTGELRNGLPEDLLSIATPIPYIKDATCNRWELFLNEIFDKDQAVINFIQRAIGYSLFGYTSEQCLFLCVGNGANGKSVLLDTIRKVVGDYGYSAPFSTFERSANPSQQSNDIAALVNKRVVTASETNEGSSINEARIKSLTGGDLISARFLHQEYFQFTPICKLWLGVNHLPKVRDDSNGFWRRVKKIDFPVSFNESSADKSLADKLALELPGILAWSVKGAMLWKESGLQVPGSVISAVEEYKEDSDPLRDFIAQYCDLGESYMVRTDELYRNYVKWCNDNQLKPYERLASDRFHARLMRDHKRSTDALNFKTYTGIHIKENLTRVSTNFSVNIRKLSIGADNYKQ